MNRSVDIGRITLIGGDLRQVAAYEHLRSLGAECELFGFRTAPKNEPAEALGKSDCVILPLPLSKDSVTVFSDKEYLNLSITELLSMLHPGQKIFAGLVSGDISGMFASRGLTLTDYYRDEALLVYNAQLTAQGLLRVILENTDRLFSNQKVLVTGYGRVGRAAATLLYAAGADVYAAVRRPGGEAAASTDGIKAVYYSELKSRIFDFDVIINTVPAPIIDKSLIRCADKSCLLLEAASAPYGFDMQAAKQYGRKLIMCSGMPGKYTPVSAGRVIADTVIRLNGEGKSLK